VSETKKHCLFISDNLRDTDSTLAKRILGAIEEINATAIEVVCMAEPVASSCKSTRTLDSDLFSDAEQVASLLIKKAGSSSKHEMNVYAQGVQYENALGAASA
jgi:hypothetical protein